MPGANGESCIVSNTSGRSSSAVSNMTVSSTAPAREAP
jgi:hypothetical protein